MINKIKIFIHHPSWHSNISIFHLLNSLFKKCSINPCHLFNFVLIPPQGWRVHQIAWPSSLVLAAASWQPVPIDVLVRFQSGIHQLPVTLNWHCGLRFGRNYRDHPSCDPLQFGSSSTYSCQNRHRHPDRVQQDHLYWNYLFSSFIQLWQA